MRPVAGALVALTLLACDLGLDESQIGAGGAGSSTTAQVGTTSGPGSSTSQTTSTVGSTSASSTGASTAASTSASTSVASTSSTGGIIMGSVRCFNGQNMQDCPDGQVCCRHPGDETLDHCSATPCEDDFSQFECDGPEDCPGNEDCCAPAGLNADITCMSTCPNDDDVVCDDSGDCVITFDCGSNLQQPYSTSYKTCAF